MGKHEKYLSNLGQTFTIFIIFIEFQHIYSKTFDILAKLCRLNKPEKRNIAFNFTDQINV